MCDISVDDKACTSTGLQPLYYNGTTRSMVLGPTGGCPPCRVIFDASFLPPGRALTDDTTSIVWTNWTTKPTTTYTQVNAGNGAGLPGGGTGQVICIELTDGSMICSPLPCCVSGLTGIKTGLSGGGTGTQLCVQMTDGSVKCIDVPQPCCPTCGACDQGARPEQLAHYIRLHGFSAFATAEDLAEVPELVTELTGLKVTRAERLPQQGTRGNCPSITLKLFVEGKPPAKFEEAPREVVVDEEITFNISYPEHPHLWRPKSGAPSNREGAAQAQAPAAATPRQTSSQASSHKRLGAGNSSASSHKRLGVSTSSGHGQCRRHGHLLQGAHPAGNLGPSPRQCSFYTQHHSICT